MGASPQRLVEEAENKGWAQDLARRWAKSGRAVSAHYAIDADGQVVEMLDPAKDVAYHAGQVNEVTIGIELYQSWPSGDIYAPCLEACLALCDRLTARFGIQRQMCDERKIARRFASPVKSNKRSYLKGGGRGRDFVGLYGHRNCTRNRGIGDPGDIIWRRFMDAGYEVFKTDKGQDLDVWRIRQRDMGMPEHLCDGIPGPTTHEYMMRYKPWSLGMWVDRPSDTDLYNELYGQCTETP